MNNRDEYIQSLRDQGCNLIELKPKSKIPIGSWKTYQSVINESVFAEGANYAVLAGSISKDLVIIDVDKMNPDDPNFHAPVDLEFLNDIIPNVLSRTLVVKTGTGGYHIYIRHTKSVKNLKSLKLDSGDMHIDIQSEGKYVVGPGSTHNNGNPYEIVSTTPTIMSLDFGFISMALEKLGFTPNKDDVKHTGLQKIIFANEDWDALEKGHIKMGQRNEKMHKLLVRRLCYDKLFDTLEHAESFASDVNQKMKEFGTPSLPSHELNATVKSAWSFFVKNKEQGTLFEKSKEGKQIEASAMGNLLMASNKFVTIRENMRMYLYKEGVYYAHGEYVRSIIQEECYKVNALCKMGWVEEVIHYIEANTMMDLDRFDSNPDEYVVNNGIMNIRTRELRAHDPEFYSFIKIPVDFNPTARCPKFNNFLRECFTVNGNFLAKDYFTVLEVLGLVFLKHTRLEKAIMFIGGGSNGKSTFLDILQAVLGKDNVAARAMQDLAKEKFAKVELYQKLANVFSDIQGSELYDTGMLKSMISGDKIVAEEKYAKTFTFRPFSKLIFSANKFPPVSDQSSGFFRRFVIVEWLRVFDNTNKKISLKHELTNDTAELSGILNLAIRLALMLEKRGHFMYEKSISEMRNKWNEKSEPINTFLDKETVPDDSEVAVIPVAMLYAHYVRWCRASNLVEEKPRKFNRVLDQAGLTQSVKRTDNAPTRVWLNLRLVHPLGGKQTELDGGLQRLD